MANGQVNPNHFKRGLTVGFDHEPTNSPGVKVFQRAVIERVDRKKRIVTVSAWNGKATNANNLETVNVPMKNCYLFRT